MVMACFVVYLPVVIMVSHALTWLQLHSTVTTMSEHGQQLPITMGNNQHGEKHIKNNEFPPPPPLLAKNALTFCSSCPCFDMVATTLLLQPCQSMGNKCQCLAPWWGAKT